MIDPRLSRITSRDLDHRSVYIVSLDINFDIIVNQFIRFITVSYQSFFGIKFVHSSAVKERFIPGAIFAAIIAASIGNVPLPQNGSTRILSLCHGVSMISAAASVSVIGAFPDTSRYPLLCRDTPDVSIPTVTTSFFRKTTDRICCSVFRKPFYLVLLLHSSYHRFFITDWISDG